MGKSSPDQKTRVTQYSASVHYGLCYGPVDNISRILVKEKVAWEGIQASQGSIIIRNTKLFGGSQKEGGVEGIAEYLPGGGTQVIPEILANKAGRTAATMPAYRGIASVWFYGRNLIEEQAENSPGFYWGANNPYLPSVWATVSRTSVGLDPSNARIGADSNPAHMIYECLTNVAWGMGAPSTNIDVNSFLKAATTLAAEGLGLSMIWTRQSSIEAFVSEILDHIEAVLFVSPRTGLLTLKLIREDTSGILSVYFLLDRSNSLSSAEFAAIKSAANAGLDILEEAIIENSNRRIDIAVRFYSTGSTAIGFTNCTVANIASIRAFIAAAGQVTGGQVDLAFEHIEDWFTATVGVEFNRRAVVFVTDTTTEDGMTDAAAGPAADMLDRGSGIFNTTDGTAVDLYAINYVSTNTTWTSLLDNTPQDGIPIITSSDSTGLTNAISGLISDALAPRNVFTPENSKITKFGRKMLGEMISEIVATFTNASNEEEETVVAQDLAVAAMQGGLVSDSRNFYGVRSRTLAMKLAQRDLRAAAAPLASCDIEVSREAWDLLPGDLVNIESPEDGIELMKMRVGPIDYGRPGASTIKAQLVEDVWSLPLAEYTVPPETEAVDLREEPAPASDELIFTLPLFMVATEINTDVSDGAEYPTVFAGVLASQTGFDTPSFDLIGTLVDAAGNPYTDSLGVKTIASRAELTVAIPAEVETVILSFPDRTQGPPPTIGGFVFFGPDDETEIEIALITDIETGVGYTLNRGVLDTVPRAWPIGTTVWFVTPDVNDFGDNTPRSDGETVAYKILPQTSKGTLDEGDAALVSETLTGRPHLPFRPANVVINGVAFAENYINAEGVDPIVVTWSERNRLTEDSLVLAWDAASVTAEVGQTTRITVSDESGTPLTVHDSLVGTTFNLPLASFLGEARGLVKVESVRDGLVSLQGYEMLVVVESGYGYHYGYNYGGA